MFQGSGASIIGREPKTIGSIRNGQTNYSNEHTFFNKDTHMFPKAQKVRDVVRDEIDRDLLGTKSVKWNSSVSLP